MLSQSRNGVGIILWAWILAVACFTICVTNSSKCEFEAIFNFGDSNSDTGGFWAAFPAQSGPFGMTFFHKPVGRATDGRLVIDFLAQALGFPFISPYLQSIGSNYVHGVNYATLASTVLLPNTSLFVTGISPFSLAIQLNQMKDFKLRVEQYSSDPQESKRLPSRDVFGKSIYSFYIGQNDFTSNLNAIGVEGVKQYLPKVVDQIANTIKGIYAIGGRTFLVLNMAPVGCYPSLLATFPHQNSDIDPFGCLVPLNDGVIYYNNLLKKALDLTRQSLSSDAKLIYVDIFSIMLELFRHPTSHSLKYGPRACCGYGGGAYNFNPNVYCGNTKLMEGESVSAQACGDPYNYVSWDGIHASDAANKIVTDSILTGHYFDPPFPLNQLCDLQPIG